MAEARIGTYEELVELADVALQPIMVALRAKVIELHKDAVEVVRLGDKAATYGVGPAKMKEGYVYIMPQKKWINIGFYEGAKLNDPDGVLEGTGKMLRHVKVYDLEIANGDALADLIAQSIALRKEKFGIL